MSTNVFQDISDCRPCQPPPIGSDDPSKRLEAGAKIHTLELRCADWLVLEVAEWDSEPLACCGCGCDRLRDVPVDAVKDGVYNDAGLQRVAQVAKMEWGVFVSSSVSEHAK